MGLEGEPSKSGNVMNDEWRTKVIFHIRIPFSFNYNLCERKQLIGIKETEIYKNKV